MAIRRMTRPRLAGLVGLLLIVVVLIAAAAPRRSTPPTRVGRLDELRQHGRREPLLAADADHARRTSRSSAASFTFDLNKVVPGIKKGQQSYPIVVNGVLYITSGDDQVFAVNGVTGDMIWHYAPDNLATFKNYGIVANRGVAYCDNRIFLLTLDMTIVALDPATGKQLARVPIGRAVPGAYANYGYSETSAPICANHTVVVGAAGSDYGVRGFVMAYHTDLTPAWANPFWIIPPAGTEWRSARAASSAARPTGRRRPSIRPRTRSTSAPPRASPAYYPSLRPGSDPRARLAGRRRPRDREAEVVAAAASPRTSGPTTPRSRRSSTRRRSAARASASSRSRRWRASGSPTTPPRARRSTSG